MEKRRLKLGVMFNFDPSWMGGIIYIINIVKTLNFLDDAEKPEITLFYKPRLKRFLEEFDYPYIRMVEHDYPSLIKGNIRSMILRKNLFIKDILRNHDLDAVYPLQDYPVRTRTGVRLISWSADFQHRHYPEFFSRKQRLGRNLRVRNALRNTGNLVLSSHDAHKDLEKFFRVPEGLRIHI